MSKRKSSEIKASEKEVGQWIEGLIKAGEIFEWKYWNKETER